MVRIVLIEDNPDDTTLTLRAFKHLGIAEEVQAFRDGESALDFLFGRGAHADAKAAGAVRLILLDLNLPKVSGLNVLREVRLNPQTKHIPVVVLTVSRQEPDLLQSFTMGVSDYIIKPMEQERLVHVYRTYVAEGSL